MSVFEGYIYRPKGLHNFMLIGATYARRWIIASLGPQQGAQMIEHCEMFPAVVDLDNIEDRMESWGVETAGGTVMYVKCADNVDFRHKVPPSILI